jgi:outer membrane lipoprotein-sorting protein
MRLLRTVSTRRLLAGLAGLLIVCVGGTAIALAAAGNGPVPKHRSLAAAVHRALSARGVRGLYATINFTNNLIGANNVQGSDPLLAGGPGRLWVGQGRVRLEIQSSSSSDAEVVFNRGSFWAYDPAMNVVYRGTLPTGAKSAGRRSAKTDSIPTIAQIQKDLNRLAKRLSVSGAHPTDVGGQPAYRVVVSPKTGGGLLGDLKLAWDANHGIPLDFAVYAKGDMTPVLELAASGISYGRQPASVFNLKPPSGARVVKLSLPKAMPAGRTKAGRKHSGKAITGVKGVRKHLSFALAAPGVLAGRVRHSVSLIGAPGHHGAALFYGKGLGGILVIERPASAGGSALPSTTSGSGNGPGLTLPTVHINGAIAQQLPTPLGTVLQFTRNGVSYLVVGSVDPSTADAAARGL